MARLEKKIPSTVREASVYQHDEGSPLIRWCCDGPRGFRGALNWVPLMPRD